MSRDGNGNYSLPESAFIGGTVINSTIMNSNLSDIATALTGSISADGQTTPSANLKMGTYKLTGLGAGSALTDSCNISQQQNSFGQYAVSAGTNTVTLALTPAITAYATGQRFTFKAGGTNTGATTLNINSVGAKAIKLIDGSALSAGVIVLDRIIDVEYDGTNFILLNYFDSKTSSELASTFAAKSIAHTAVNTSNIPSFLATVSSAIPDVTGNSDEYDVLFDTETYDLASNYAPATGKFTAPVAGSYVFITGIYFTGMTNAAKRLNVYLQATGGQFLLVRNNPESLLYGGTGFYITASRSIHMAAGDTVGIRVQVRDTTKTVDIGSDSFFSGYILNRD